VEFSRTIQISRSPDFIFKVLTDLENLPVWQFFDMQVTQTSAGPGGEGAEYRLNRKGEVRTLRITEFNQDRSMAVETLEAKPPRAYLRFDLDPLSADQTRLGAQARIETGLPGLVEKMAAGRAGGYLDDGMRRLKELLETGRTTTPDGRELRLREE
jgi:hypothetical protein